MYETSVPSKINTRLISMQARAKGARASNARADLRSHSNVTVLFAALATQCIFLFSFEVPVTFQINS